MMITIRIMIKNKRIEIRVVMAVAVLKLPI